MAQVLNPGLGQQNAIALDPSGNPSKLAVDSSNNLLVASSGGGGGGAVTVADGADVTQGAEADAANTTGTTGTISGKLRGLVTLLAQAFNLGTPLRIDPVGATTQPVSGSVTAAGGLTHNNAAPSTNNVGALTAVANAAVPSFTEGDLVLESADLSGNLRTKQCGSAFNTGQVSITNSATSILAANSKRMRLTLVMLGTTADVYLGASGVSTSTGQLFAAIKGNQILIRSTAAIYGIVASSTQTITYLEETSS